MMGLEVAGLLILFIVVTVPISWLVDRFLLRSQGAWLYLVIGVAAAAALLFALRPGNGPVAVLALAMFVVLPAATLTTWIDTKVREGQYVAEVRASLTGPEIATDDEILGFGWEVCDGLDTAAGDRDLVAQVLRNGYGMPDSYARSLVDVTATDLCRSGVYVPFIPQRIL